MEPTKAIKAIERTLNALDSIAHPNEFSEWENTAISTLESIYPDRNKLMNRFSEICSFTWYDIGSVDEVKAIKPKVKRFLENLIVDIKDLGIVETENKSKNGGVNVNVNQTNTQSQSTSVNIDLNIVLEAIKDELPGKHYKELKEILESKEEPKEKKKKFFDKIKSFGVEVSSNILANLLTNPMVFEQLGKVF